MIDRRLIRIKILARWEKLIRDQDAMPALCVAWTDEGDGFLLTGEDVRPEQMVAILERAAADIRAGNLELIGGA